MGKAGGRGSLGREKKGGKEERGHKSPAWSSQDLGSTPTSRVYSKGTPPPKKK